MAQNGLPNTSPTRMPHDSALSIGSSAEGDVAKIRDLEDEVRVLAEKANSASQRFADYENEIRVLEAKLRQEQRKNSTSSDSGAAAEAVAKAVQRPGISRFGSFIGSRKADGLPNGSLQPPVGTARELEEKLVQEQTARFAAEKKVKEVSAEIEDLSATLFQQANEMVATERRQNAELKEKLKLLEEQQQETANGTSSLVNGSSPLQKENEQLKRKIQALEQREGDRKKRLERLEAANKRIDRVKAMLHPP